MPKQGIVETTGRPSAGTDAGDGDETDDNCQRAGASNQLVRRRQN